MIQDIEELGSQLEVKVFRDAADVVIFEHRKIEIYQSRAYYAIAVDISEKVFAGSGSGRKWRALRLERGGRACRKRRQSEAIQIDVIGWVPRIYRLASCNSIRKRPWVVTVQTQWVPADQRSKGLTGLRSENAANFPPSKKMRRDSSPIARLWYVIEEVQHEGVCDVEVGQGSAPRPKIKRARNRVRKWVAEVCRGTGINTLRPGIRGLSLKAMAERLGSTCNECIVE